jgi:hypothetical protein
MRATTLPGALGVTVALHLLCYAAGVPAGISNVVAVALGCASYVVLGMRESEDER